MKRTWKYLLMAALVVGLGMNVTSCKDDNDENNNERTPEEIAQDPYEKESEAADALYRLVSQLSICDSLPNDWKTATFEPKAGKVLDASQPRVRTIAVNNAAEAVARYNSLTGKELPATTTSDTYKVEGVGTLQLNVGGAGTIATIDVDVKQMPQLAQLRFVSVADMGENGHFKGEPYYRFGDVVKDKDGCYWICVRPAYSPNGKEDTHWMSFQLTEKNLKTYTKKGCQQQVYPVDLGVQKEKMQYLAQLLAILANPDSYQTEAGLMGEYFNGTGLGGLQPAAMPVDSLVKQARLWNENKIWEKIMPVGFKPDEVQTFKDFFKNASVAFIYEKGSTSGTNLTIKVVLYPEANKFYKEAPIYEKEKVDMREIAFDVTNSYSTKGKRTNDNCTVPDAFVVRYKSGYQLSSNLIFSPSATDSIPGVTTVFRFNAGKVQDNGQPQGKKHTMTTIDGLSFEYNDHGIGIFPTYPAQGLTITAKWAPGARKREITLYAFLESKTSGEKRLLDDNETSDYRDETPFILNIKNFEEDDYVLYLTQNENGNDPCVFVKDIRVEKPRFDFEWIDVPESMVIQNRVLTGKVKMTLRNINTLQYSIIYQLLKNVQTGETQVGNTHRVINFTKDEPVTLDVRYVVNTFDDYEVILALDKEGTEVLAKRSIKGLSTSKKADDITHDDLFSIIGADGMVYPDRNTCAENGVRPVGVIVLFPYENAHDNQEMNLCREEGDFYDRNSEVTPFKVEAKLGMNHGMAILVNQPFGGEPSFNIVERSYAEAVDAINSFNTEGHPFYVKGIKWQLPSVYLIQRMIIENQPSGFMFDSPNMARWKCLQFLNTSTANNAASNRWCLIDAFEDAQANIKENTKFVHLPDNFWMLETITYNDDDYALSLCHDYNYPRGGDKEHSYYFPREIHKDIMSGFMPVLVW